MAKGLVSGGECASLFCTNRGARSSIRKVGTSIYLCQSCATEENDKQVKLGNKPSFIVKQDQR